MSKMTDGRRDEQFAMHKAQTDRQSVMRALSREFIGAFYGDFRRAVWAPTPDHQEARKPLFDVVRSDILDDVQRGPEMLDRMLQIIRAADRSTDPALRLMSQALIADMAQMHCANRIDDAMPEVPQIDPRFAAAHYEHDLIIGGAA